MEKKAEILLRVEVHPCFPVRPSGGWRRRGGEREEGEEEEVRAQSVRSQSPQETQEGRVELNF